MSHVTNSLVVEFEQPDETVASKQIIIERDDDLEPELLEQEYLRVHVPTNGTLVINKNTGTLSYNGIKTVEVIDYLLFNKNSETSIRHPNISALSFSKEGSYFDENGNVVTTTLSYDPITGNIKSSRESVFGVVKVSYRAHYRSYLYTFSGGPCPLNPDPEADSPFNVGVVFGFDLKNGTAESLTLQPPSCVIPSSPNSSKKDKPADEFVMEVESTGRPSFTAVAGVLSATATFRIYPADNSIEVDSNLGSLTRINQSFTIDVEEILQFTGESSAQLSYPPKQGVSITPIGDMIDGFGRNIFIPKFRTPGQDMFDVERPDKFSYRNPERRDVTSREIASVDAGRRALPAFGLVRAEYQTTYTQYNYVFHLNDNLDSDGRKQFDIAFITALRDSTSETLRLDPPSLEGLL